MAEKQIPGGFYGAGGFQVPGGPPGGNTLAATYAVGTVPADQTMVLLDARGGTVILNGAGLTGAFPYTLSVLGNQFLGQSLAVGVDVGSVPTARVHISGGSLNAGSASLKLDQGFLMTVPEVGAIESNGTHLWWTDAGGIRRQLDNGAAGAQTLAATYDVGAAAVDQTLILTNAKGGAFILNGTTPSPLFTGVTVFEANVLGGSINFYTRGGFDVSSTISVAAAVGSTWNEVDFVASTLTLTGGPATATAVAMVHIGQGIINGAGNTVSDSYNLLVENAPTGTAALTRAWSAGFVGPVQVTASKTITAAPLATWNGISIESSTLTISGAFTPITELCLFNIASPIITAASAVVATECYSLKIGSPNFAGVGPASATRAFALGVSGNAKLDGGITFKGTDLNIAGPYNITESDYAIEVRYTLTGAITLNLPSIATVGNGRTIPIIDSGYNATTNNITIAPNGADKINNVVGNYMITASGTSLILKSNLLTGNWEIIAQSSSGGGGGGINYITDYDVDFTAQPTQELFDGANVIDGVTWTVANKANTTYFGVLNAVGLQIWTFNAIANTEMQGTDTSAPHMTTPLPPFNADLTLKASREIWLWAQITVDNSLVSYNAGAMLALEARFSPTLFTRLSVTRNTFFTNNCVVALSNESGTQAYAGQWSGAGPDTETASAVVAPTVDVYAIRFHDQVAEIYYGTYAAGWPTRSALILRAILRTGTQGVGAIYSAFSSGFQTGSPIMALFANEARANVLTKMIVLRFKIEHLPVESAP